MAEDKTSPWFFWPFIAIWRLLTWILELTGRMVVVIVGLVLILVGTLLSLTVIGAAVGIPVGVFGILLVLRGLF
ncbi:MAG: hypothetical protein PVF49_02925 [Anaerolineales bacterium]|jgi:hypothetical protein